MGKAHNIPCAFMDLPTSAFLSLDTKMTQGRIMKLIWIWMPMINGNVSLNMKLTVMLSKKPLHFFAHNLREIKPADEFTLLRESYMNTTIQKLIKQGIHEDDIVVVCGAFHIEGIMEAKVLPDAQYEKLQKISLISH